MTPPYESDRHFPLTASFQSVADLESFTTSLSTMHPQTDGFKIEYFDMEASQGKVEETITLSELQARLDIARQLIQELKAIEDVYKGTNNLGAKLKSISFKKKHGFSPNAENRTRVINQLSTLVGKQLPTELRKQLYLVIFNETGIDVESLDQR